MHAPDLGRANLESGVVKHVCVNPTSSLTWNSGVTTQHENTYEELVERAWLIRYIQYKELTKTPTLPSTDMIVFEKPAQGAPITTNEKIPSIRD